MSLEDLGWEITNHCVARFRERVAGRSISYSEARRRLEALVLQRPGEVALRAPAWSRDSADGWFRLPGGHNGAVLVLVRQEGRWVAVTCVTPASALLMRRLCRNGDHDTPAESQEHAPASTGERS